MSTTRQTLLASRPAAMVLALTLVAGLTAPFVMLPRATAATATACTVTNHNGCTELSPTPPEDTATVPPNIMLMLDDSGSMRWDVMPDWSYLPAPNWSTWSGSGWNYFQNDAVEPLIDSDINGIYYNPSITYAVPPKADGTLYPASSFSAALVNGFDSTSASVDLSTYRGRYDSADTSYEGTSVQYSISVAKVGATSYAATACPSGSAVSGKYPGYCYFGSKPGIAFSFYDMGNGDFYVVPCTSISDVYDNSTKTCMPGISFFTYTTSNTGGGYTRHYVAKNVGDCAAAGLAAAVCDETAAAQQNVATWFTYYHTRILMAKSGMMTAFSGLSPQYRFGFGSINGSNNGKLPSPTGTFGLNNNKIAEVQPFGDGTSGTQKANFWNWLSTISPNSSTPLRRSLDAVGKYYQSSQPWTTMSSDPGYSSGSSTQFACRAAFTILTTDGFWNGGDPGTGNVANSNGATYTGVGGITAGYKAADPFQGGAGASGATSLADVATYYWENDLQTGTGFPNEVPTTSRDPAFWQHMTTFTVGLGFDPTGIISGTDAGGKPVTVPEIFNWAQAVDAGTTPPMVITGFGWPTPSPDSINNIADLAHAAVNGHGDFTSAKNPAQLSAYFTKVFSEIGGAIGGSKAAAVNVSVVTAGALSFATSYNPKDWSGDLDGVLLAADGTIDPTKTAWSSSASDQLDAAYHNNKFATRVVFTDAYKLTKSGGVVTARSYDGSFQFTAGNSIKLDDDEVAGLETPALSTTAGSPDTLDNRINYLLGDNQYEASVYRARNHLMGAVVHAQPVYVSYPASGYFNNWPSGSSVPETMTGAESYDTFVNDYANRPGTLYVAANDGMLHAFAAPAPTGCTPGPCTYVGGKELWAFIPRAVYANLGNLTSFSNFSYRPTVDATPVTRDVFFGEPSVASTDNKWHTMLVGGVGLGGRGVYALDITGTKTATATSPDLAPTSVMWEFDSDMTMTSSCVTNDSTACKSSDLGYTVSQPNIGRIAYKNSWVVLVPNGYFPDCTTPDTPTDNTLPATNPASCAAIAAQAPKDASGKPYSALFVVDAQTGDVIAELKTPTGLTDVTSYGLATPVMGAYDGGQVDQVAFAGDMEGNLWRFDLSSSTGPSAWTVTLAYKGAADASNNQGLQPITSMPRLFPDPLTNRFMVVFGTGRYLGVGDNVTNKDASGNYLLQAIYGIRDQGPTATSTTAYTQSNLVQQYLSETTLTTGPLAGASVRCITGGAGDSCNPGPGSTSTPLNPVPGTAGTKQGGWFINLKTSVSGVQNDVGERVVVTPGAIFSSNTVVVQTLITGGNNNDPCNPSTKGSVLFINIADGGPGTGVSSLGGYPAAGARVDHARTSGSLPIVSALGGGKVYVPGMELTGTTSKAPITGDLPIWRRRSWNEIKQNQ